MYEGSGGTAEEAEEKLDASRKGDHRGLSPHPFSTAYAALKGRSSTVAPRIMSFSAASEAVPYHRVPATSLRAYFAIQISEALSLGRLSTWGVITTNNSSSASCLSLVAV